MRSYRSKTAEAATEAEEHFKPRTVTHFNLKRLGYAFYDESFDVSFWGIFTLSLIVGIVGGTYGIGGGSIIAPFFVTFSACRFYTVAGAALMGTFLTSVAGVAFYQAVAPLYPSSRLALGSLVRRGWYGPGCTSAHVVRNSSPPKRSNG